MMKRIVILALTPAVLWTGTIPAQEVGSPNDQARFLAGLSVTAGPLAGLDDAEHRSGMEQAWSDVESRQLAEIRMWAPLQLGTVYASTDPLFYFYSGPDFLYANAFFPNASTYVLCGKEPVGVLPDVTMLAGGRRVSALRGLRNALESSLKFSFFITADMKNDLSNTALSGTLPVLYVYLARMGCWLSSVELGGLNADGVWVQEDPKTKGAKLIFEGALGRPQTLYYFTTDLSNWGIADRPEFMTFCAQLGLGNGLVKSASYLMHLSEFSKSRDFLLGHVNTLVQDDSGIPYQYFKWEDWVVGCHGSYLGPISLFKEKYQRDLAAAFDAQAAMPLPFGIGYRWRKNESCLMVATSLRSVPKAIPVSVR